MTLIEFRQRRALAAKAKGQDEVDDYADDRDAAIAAAWRDYTVKAKSAEVAYQRTVDAINAGEFDHEHSGDAA